MEWIKERYLKEVDGGEWCLGSIRKKKKWGKERSLSVKRVGESGILK